MSDKRQFEFFLLQYAPDPIKEEAVNVGVVLLGVGEDAAYAKVRITPDWRRVLCLDSDADLELLDALGRDLQSQLANVEERAAVMKRIQESFCGAVQLSATRACVAQEPDEELEALAKLYLQSRSQPGKREVSSRQRILRIMHDEFERAGVWKLMQHQIPVADYTFAGDPLKIDCGYRPNGTMKMFHAVPLSANVDLAKILAFTYPMIVEGMKQKKVGAELTAVIDRLDRDRTEADFALRAMRQNGIRISLTEEMPALADHVRQELRA
jgi:hypothetical protein